VPSIEIMCANLRACIQALAHVCVRVKNKRERKKKCSNRKKEETRRERVNLINIGK
jgi:hypothetical protein